MNSKHLLAAAALAVSLSPAKAITVTFDDLPNPPALTGAVDIQEAIGTGSLFDGVMWGSNVEVVGRLSRVDPGTPGPVFGLPHSGASKHAITRAIAERINAMLPGTYDVNAYGGQQQG